MITPTPASIHRKYPQNKAHKNRISGFMKILKCLLTRDESNSVFREPGDCSGTEVTVGGLFCGGVMLLLVVHILSMVQVGIKRFCNFQKNMNHPLCLFLKATHFIEWKLLKTIF